MITTRRVMFLRQLPGLLAAMAGLVLALIGASSWLFISLTTASLGWTLASHFFYRWGMNDRDTIAREVVEQAIEEHWAEVRAARHN